MSNSTKFTFRTLFLYGGKEMKKTKEVSLEQLDGCVHYAAGDKIQVLLGNKSKNYQMNIIDFSSFNNNYSCYQVYHY